MYYYVLLLLLPLITIVTRTCTSLYNRCRSLNPTLCKSLYSMLMHRPLSRIAFASITGAAIRLLVTDTGTGGSSWRRCERSPISLSSNRSLVDTRLSRAHCTVLATMVGASKTTTVLCLFRQMQVFRQVQVITTARFHCMYVTAFARWYGAKWRTW